MNDKDKIGLASSELDANNITFTIKADTDMPEELIRINTEGFFWKGKLVVEDKEIYDRFKEWLEIANAEKEKPRDFNTIDKYQNLISLMQEALKFYADQRNYAGYMGDPASIDLDEYGSQARFALKKVEETLDADKKLQEDYNKVISETIKAIEDTPIDLTSAIKTFKNLGDD